MDRSSPLLLTAIAALLWTGPALSQQLGEPLSVTPKAAPATPVVKRPAVIPMPVPRPAEFGSAAAHPTHVASAASTAAPTLAAAPARTNEPAPPVDNSPRGILDRANASLNAMTVVSAEFSQVGASGRRQAGRLYVQKPGRMRFEYDPPNPVEIVADGKSVAIRDRKLNTQDLYAIGQTPLKFLLKERVDLARDTKVIDVRTEGPMASVTIEDKSTFGGTSRVTLFFDQATFALKQWIVVDPQGYETAVAINRMTASAQLDPKLFDINYMRLLDDGNSR